MSANRTQPPKSGPTPSTDDALQIVRQSLSQLKFGAIQLVVHEGRLVQLEVTERRRFST